MTTLKTYILTIVFELKGDMIRATEYFGEQDVKRELADAKFYISPDSKEIRLKYTLQRALTEAQLERLEYLKQIEVCSDFSVEAVEEVLTEEETAELSEKLGFDVNDHEQLKSAWQQNIDDLRNLRL